LHATRAGGSKLAEAVAAGDHLGAAGLRSVVVESSLPLRLRAWQDLLRRLPPAVVRAKGFLFFACEPAAQ